ncbi:uncharacterized protein CDAR_308451 [Caerostris darwini]|uniref:Uncharacterized protein n=1 Tax=Caerostris darwini TaxID=1538125 RepID=A0AAV4TS80_9ARAC|nr:uncharacterized protein CDAR_308451 [Caerostris darwini]
MKLELVLAFLWSMVLLTCTKEVPLDEQNESNKSDTTTDSADIDWDAFKDSRDSTNENPSIKDNTSGRWNHSRMLLRSSTTLDYDEWWFFTTRRPILSHKDYPGKPGVATWKEISPSSTENRKNRNIANPTAAGVSSPSWAPSPEYLTTSYIIVAVLFFF